MTEKAKGTSLNAAAASLRNPTNQCVHIHFSNKRRPDSEKKRVDASDSLSTSVAAMPVMMLADHKGAEMPLEFDHGWLDPTDPSPVGADGSWPCNYEVSKDFSAE